MPTPQPYLLLVDDDPDDRELFREEFSARNPKVILKYASSGQEALTLLENFPPAALPAVMLIDYQMPGLNGLGLEDCKRFGASHYLVKPATNAELHKVIHQLTAVLDHLSHE